MNFIKRYKARRAKRKEIKQAYKELTSLRILKGASMLMDAEDTYWIERVETKSNHIAKLQEELCKL